MLIMDIEQVEFNKLLVSLGYVSKDLYSKYEMKIAFEVFKSLRQQLAKPSDVSI